MADIIGGYTLHESIREKEKAIFDQALKGVRGVDYVPLAVASQVVNGMNYVFICTATPVVPNPMTVLCTIKIYTKFEHSVGSQIRIEGITQIPLESLIK